MENSAGIPGISYDFNTQNIATFENNRKYKGGMVLVAYIDFETAPTDSFQLKF